MIPQVGQRFGPYEILSRVGSGGMGSVFRAWDGRLHREVAVKLLHSEFPLPGVRERFLREARAASALNHPNICTIFDIGDQDGEPYLVMELLEGETVKSRIASGILPTDELVRYAAEIAGALGAAHARGIVHRDIKPANIFLSDLPHGMRQAKVLDFGLATFAPNGKPHGLDLTTAGATVGTVAYMSPEQARGEMLDARSDLFSLGVVLYEMATRQTPFAGTTSALIFVQLLGHEPEPVRDWNEAVPKDLEHIIMRLLTKDRGARFQSALELQQALSETASKPLNGWVKKPPSAPEQAVRGPEPPTRTRYAPPRSRDGTDGPAPDPSRELPPLSDQGRRNVEPPATPRPSRRSEDPPRIEPRVNGVSRPPAPARPPWPSSGSPLTPPPSAPGSKPAPDSKLTPSEVTIRPVLSVPFRPTEPAPERSAPPPSAERPLEDNVSLAAAAPDLAEAFSAKNPDLPGKFPDSPSRTSGQSSKTSDQPTKTTSRPSRPPPDSRSATSSPAFVPLPALPSASVTNVRPESSPSRGRMLTALSKKKQILLGSGVALLLVLAAGAFWLARRSGSHAALSRGSTLLVATIQNRTGDETLNGALSEGIAIQLRQSRNLTVRGMTAYEAGLSLLGVDPNAAPDPTVPRKVAQRIGAKYYLSGDVSGSGSYVLSIAIMDTQTNTRIAAVEETASGREQLAAAIVRVSDSVRSELGEGGDTIARSDSPLDREGTANIEALHALAAAEALGPSGRSLDAIGFYQKAVALDPHFILAQIGLSWALRQQHAEVAAADAARAAQSSASQASERLQLLAQYTYDINSSGDWTHGLAVTRQLVTEFPGDGEALSGLARVLRLQGHLPEALQAAQSAIEADPFRIEAYEQAELCMLGMDRYDAAVQMGTQAQRMGLAQTGSSRLASFLAGDAEAASPAAVASRGKASNLGETADQATILDNTGRIAAGREAWRALASRAASVRGLESAAALWLSQAALNRALIGDCGSSLELVRSADEQPRGPTALFNQGLAAALCGDNEAAGRRVQLLKRDFVQNTAVTGYLLPDLQAAMLMRSSNPSAALDLLKAARPYDAFSLTPYLRGLAHLASRDTEIGVVDFQIVLAHRGSSTAGRSLMYPMSQLGLARAFAQSGDTGNSAHAYKAFLDLWKNGDKEEPVIQEARAKAR